MCLCVWIGTAAGLDKLVGGAAPEPAGDGGKDDDDGAKAEHHHAPPAHHAPPEFTNHAAPLFAILGEHVLLSV